MYWWIVIIVVIVLILILSFERFEIDDSIELNNIIDITNSNEIKSKDIIASRIIEGQTIGGGLKSEMMKIVYPIESIYLSRKRLNLDNENDKQNTPLEFGKWKYVDQIQSRNNYHIGYVYAKEEL